MFIGLFTLYFKIVIERLPNIMVYITLFLISTIFLLHHIITTIYKTFLLLIVFIILNVLSILFFRYALYPPGSTVGSASDSCINRP